MPKEFRLANRQSHGHTEWASGRHRGPTPLGRGLGITCRYLGLGGRDFSPIYAPPCPPRLVVTLKKQVHTWAGPGRSRP